MEEWASPPVLLSDSPKYLISNKIRILIVFIAVATWFDYFRLRRRYRHKHESDPMWFVLIAN